ncbi:hypothetical protein [Croceimicrobium sp.]|uniref:hypothetical protein n=1 Tax=Croceimicrobium sp. TaxID=2828340 RepID=UPI003BA9A099
MGYELSIQRKENRHKISKEEWIAYVNSDPEFVQIEEYSAELDGGGSFTIPTPNAGLWKTEKGEVPFTFSEKYGEISVKNPAEWIITKMIAISIKLDAIVLGEEGELYDEKYLKRTKSNFGNEISERKWWQFWKRRNSESSYPKAISLETDPENDLFVGDCFLSKTQDFEIGLTFLEIYQGQNGKYYSLIPVILDMSKDSIDKFRYGQVKVQPFLGSNSFGIPVIGIKTEEMLRELKVLFNKVGKIEFKNPKPSKLGTSYIFDYSDEWVRDFVGKTTMYFNKEREIIPFSDLI